MNKQRNYSNASTYSDETYALIQKRNLEIKRRGLSLDTPENKLPSELKWKNFKTAHRNQKHH